MAHQTIEIDCNRITSWDSFHEVFADALGFPAGYGRNMNAWIDCMTYLDEDDGMRSIAIGPGTFLVLHLRGAGALAKRCDDIWLALLECAAFVNGRRIEQGEPAVLALSYVD